MCVFLVCLLNCFTFLVKRPQQPSHTWALCVGVFRLLGNFIISHFLEFVKRYECLILYFIRLFLFDIFIISRTRQFVKRYEINLSIGYAILRQSLQLSLYIRLH